MLVWIISFFNGLISLLETAILNICILFQVRLQYSVHNENRDYLDAKSIQFKKQPFLFWFLRAVLK